MYPVGVLSKQTRCRFSVCACVTLQRTDIMYEVDYTVFKNKLDDSTCVTW